MKRPIIHLSVFSLIAFLLASGVATVLEQLLRDYRFKTISYNATGQIALITVDAKSLAELNTWPWPRTHHAKLIDQLQKSDVSEIAFDIDFSSKTTAQADTALTKALQRADGGVILPAFKQQQKTENGQKIVYTQPLQQFQDNAWLASVNIIPGRNGHVETIAYGHDIKGEFIPSMASLLSGAYNTKDKNFYVNFSIAPDTIPVFSYVDVLKGKVNKARLKGRKVIIGATAAELGDHIYVPAQGLISGPMLQALATETLLQNKALNTLSPLVIGFGVLLIALLITLYAKKGKLAGRLYLLPLLALSIEALAIFAQLNANLIINTSIWHLTLLAYWGAILIQEVDVRKFIAKMTRIELENTRHMFEQVFKDSFSGTLIMDQNGIIQAASETSLKLLKQETNTHLQGKHIQNILPKAMQEAATDLLNNANKTGQLTHITGQTTIEDNKSDPICLEYIATLSTMQASKKQKEAPRHLISFSFQDITAEAKAEAARAEATKAALLANKAKTEFMATMSHELKTPLNSIIGFSNLIKTNAQNQTHDEDLKDHAEEIHISGKKLLKLVNDILSLTEIESETLPFHETTNDPIEMIEQAIATCAHLDQHANLNITIANQTQCPFLKSDQQLTTQTVVEILSNAIKFSPDNSEIKVDLTTTNTGEFIIQINDQGIGIAPEEVTNIFTPFYQIESAANRQFEGTGLGLTKAKAYMKLHQGDIKVESQAGQGMTINLIFPQSRVIKATETSTSQSETPEDTLLKSA